MASRPPPCARRSSPEQGVWGDIDDWHHTLDIIGHKWGPSSAFSSPRRGTEPAPPDSLESNRQTINSSHERPPLKVATATEKQQPTPGDGDKATRSRRFPSELLNVDSPRTGSAVRSPLSPSRKQRHTASLPRPSDVEALLRKETYRRRPASPVASQNLSSLVVAGEAPSAAEANGKSVPASMTAPPTAIAAAPVFTNGEGESGMPTANGPPNPDTRKRAASSYSAPTDLRDAFVSVNHSGAPNNEGLVLSLVELQKRPVPATLNKASLEVYLSDDEFSSALGMPRDQFYSLRAWKQTQVKKKAGLL